MAFWKKSEDPWDWEPDKRRPVTVTEAEETEKEARNPLERLKDWNEERKAKKAEPPLPPLSCPWCGKEMAQGYLVSGRGPVVLSKSNPSSVLWSSMGSDCMTISDEGFLTAYRPCWFCEDCRRLVADIPEPQQGPNYTWENGAVKQPDGEAPDDL